MTPKRHAHDAGGAAFLMSADDRFHLIIVSDGVRYEADDDAETVITFFVIRRADGAFDVVNVNKTFRGKQCVSRTVQGKKGIPTDRIDDEVADIEKVFARGIEDATGYRMKWNRLDLSEIKGVQAQAAAIAAWGRLGVSVDFGGTCPN
jgi:hypothetical protein